jgi:hypothetical protein
VVYRILDIFFVVFHSALLIFNLFGWVWRKTRCLNLLSLSLTGASWLFLGLLYGALGYCPLTDWHFRILEKLGRTGLPDSYVKYLADRITGMDFDASLTDDVTLFLFLAALALSLVFNFLDWKKKRKMRG